MYWGGFFLWIAKLGGDPLHLDDSWIWESFMHNEIPHHFCLEEAMTQQGGFHIDLPFHHDESHWDYSPKDNLHTGEGPLEDGTIAKNMKQWWRLLDEGATREGGEIL